MKNKKNKGFTLIELIVVAGLIVTITGFVAGIMVTSLRGGAKSKITNEVSQNANYALTAMTREIVKAENITFSGGGACAIDTGTSPWSPNTGATIVLDQIDDTEPNVELVCDSVLGSIKKNVLSTIPESYDLLDNSQVKISNCEFVCSQEDAYSAPVVQIKFTLVNANGTSAENIASGVFSTTATLRNYSPF